MLVGADGPRSSVARAAGLGRNRRFLTGAEVELDGVRGVEDRLHVFLDPRLAPGYIAWVVPGVGITQIGLAGSRPGRPPLEAFLDRISGCFDLSSARRVGNRAGLIPVGGTVRPFASRDVVLVGDAAGVVSPLTAGGIHTALDTGRTAGLAIANHLQDAGPSPDVALLGAYPRFTWKRGMRYAMDSAPPGAAAESRDREPGVPRVRAGRLLPPSRATVGRSVARPGPVPAVARGVGRSPGTHAD